MKSHAIALFSILTTEGAVVRQRHAAALAIIVSQEAP